MGKQQPQIPGPPPGLLDQLKFRVKRLLEDTAFPAIEPTLFLVDDEIRPFWLDERHDLVGTGDEACPTISNGVFIVHSHEVPEAECEVVFGTYNHVWQRENPTAPEENWVQLPPDDVAGSVLFNMRKAKNQPYIIQTDYNVPTISAAPQDRLRPALAGSTFLATNGPQLFSIGMTNQLQTFLLPASSKFQVTFQVMPQLDGAGALPNPWHVPTYPDTSNNRIDGAGAAAFGVRMPQRLYNVLKKSREVGLLGAEAS